MDHSWCRDRIILSGSELSEASCVAEGLLFRFEGDLYLTPSAYRYLIVADHARLVRYRFNVNVEGAFEPMHLRGNTRFVGYLSRVMHESALRVIREFGTSSYLASIFLGVVGDWCQ